ncbi:hypothetical protein B1B04_24940 [Lysinibacillus sp. KCTC 33748]|uniref:LamG domain-containing protein n=1 Tax=unclassified Lysinibacillus TaxID=2636778 RepID=UPI0009A6E436|nr:MULTISPECIES: laminin G domain-containing protein [unclassified Lysinibacillus]OXS65600.1 hypothetical protein B1B04_24940 [Lysinibacillus sp. KCTC 33748]SKC19511.1 Concanavalin A-like lectin/glucanases superfamily protein [Lysinibacillus sp. AC-3]
MINNILLENIKTQIAMDKYGLYWYQFNEVSGNATDSKGSPYIGTLSNATRVTGWNGEGNAIDFNGSSLVTFNNSLMTYGEKTIVLRFKTSSLNNMYIFENYATNTVNQTGYNLGIKEGKLLMRRFTSTGAGATYAFDIRSTETYNDNQWHKVMFTWNGNINQEAKLYVDDMLVGSQKSTANETSVNFATQNLVMGGCKLTTYRQYFTGQIDDFQVYNKVLTPSDFTIDKTFILHDGEYKKLNPKKPAKESINILPKMVDTNENDLMKVYTNRTMYNPTYVAFDDSNREARTVNRSGTTSIIFTMELKKIKPIIDSIILNFYYVRDIIFYGVRDNGESVELCSSDSITFSNSFIKEFKFNNTEAFSKYEIHLNGGESGEIGLKSVKLIYSCLLVNNI